MGSDIDRVLNAGRYCKDDKELLMMILSNRLTHYLGDEEGAAIGFQNWDVLCNDIIKWREHDYE